MSDTRPGAAAGPPDGAAFDAYYFKHCCGRPYEHDDHWLTFFGGIADRIVADIQPKRVLDAGCAMGLLVETLRARGVEADGIDISSYAIERADPSVRPFCRTGSIADEFPQRYDLIVSMEVVEHMPKDAAEAAIANFCRHADDVLFSSSPMDHREPTHVNVQPREYWAEQFARQGFFRDVDFDASFLTPWAIRFRRSGDPIARIVREYERRYADLELDRNERRQYVLEVQHQAAVAEERIAALERERALIIESYDRRLQALQQELSLVRLALEDLHGQVTNKVLLLDAAADRERGLHAELNRLGHELGHAHATIRNMETSIFWRMRKWLRRP